MEAAGEFAMDVDGVKRETTMDVSADGQTTTVTTSETRETECGTQQEVSSLTTTVSEEPGVYQQQETLHSVTQEQTDGGSVIHTSQSSRTVTTIASDMAEEIFSELEKKAEAPMEAEAAVEEEMLAPEAASQQEMGISWSGGGISLPGFSTEIQPGSIGVSGGFMGGMFGGGKSKGKAEGDVSPDAEISGRFSGDYKSFGMPGDDLSAGVGAGISPQVSMEAPEGQLAGGASISVGLPSFELSGGGGIAGDMEMETPNADISGGISGQLPNMDISGGVCGDLPSGQISGTLPSGQIGGELPCAEVSSGLPSADISGDISGGSPSMEISGGLPSMEISGGLPSMEISGGLPSVEISGGLPSVDISSGVSGDVTGDVSGVLPSGQMAVSGDLPSGEISGTGLLGGDVSVELPKVGISGDRDLSGELSRGSDIFGGISVDLPSGQLPSGDISVGHPSGSIGGQAAVSADLSQINGDISGGIPQTQIELKGPGLDVSGGADMDLGQVTIGGQLPSVELQGGATAEGEVGAGMDVDVHPPKSKFLSFLGGKKDGKDKSLDRKKKGKSFPQVGAQGELDPGGVNIDLSFSGELEPGMTDSKKKKVPTATLR